MIFAFRLLEDVSPHYVTFHEYICHNCFAVFVFPLESTPDLIFYCLLLKSSYHR